MTDRTGAINPGQFPISAIAIDYRMQLGRTAFVAVMGFHVGHVFKTTNAGQTWSAVCSSQNLPDAPADALVMDSQAGVIYVGTDVGVFVSSTSSANGSRSRPTECARQWRFLAERAGDGIAAF